MGTVVRFEDLEAWKQARVLARMLYRVSREPRVSRDFALITQLRKTALSPTSNIAEGFGRKSDRDFAHFLSIAHGSVAEAQSLLYVCLDEEYIDATTFEQGYEDADHCSRLIQSFARYLNEKRRTTLKPRIRAKTPPTEPTL